MSLLSTSPSLSSYCHHRRRHHYRTSLIFILSLIFQSMVKFAGATCNAAQSTSCLQAAAGGALDQLPGAGHCIVKQYVQYTHLCTVTNYLPSTDYCCCTFDARLLCCRYHQDWYHFRCMEADDELQINVSDASYASASLDLPLLTLLPVILCPLVAVAICVICMTKCWCYRYDNDSSSSSSSSSSEFYCCSCCKEDEDKKEKIPRERLADDDDATAPLQQPSSSPSQPEVQSTSVPCLRVFHPCCSSPLRFPAGVNSLPPVYHHCTTCSSSSSSTVAAATVLVDPSAPSLVLPPQPLGPPSTADDDGDPYALYFRRNQFGSDLCCRNSSMSDFRRMLPVPRDRSASADPHRSICLRSFQDGAVEFHCACAADARRNCDVTLMTRLAHEHVTAAAACADCLPPAYESIRGESRAQL